MEKINMASLVCMILCDHMCRPSRMKHRHIVCDHRHISRKALVAYKMLYPSNQLPPTHGVQNIPWAATMPKKNPNAEFCPQPNVHVDQRDAANLGI